MRIRPERAPAHIASEAALGPLVRPRACGRVSGFMPLIRSTALPATSLALLGLLLNNGCARGGSKFATGLWYRTSTDGVNWTAPVLFVPMDRLGSGDGIPVNAVPGAYYDDGTDLWLYLLIDGASYRLEVGSLLPN